MSKFKVGDRVTTNWKDGLGCELEGIVQETGAEDWFKVRLDWDGATSWVPDSRFDAMEPKGKK